MTDNINNLLSKYLNQYEKNPSSRVFAPLAEAYRKIGMIDEALKTLREGIKYHPDYQLAYLVLGNCYFDMREFDKAYDVLKEMVRKNADNLKLHKLFGEVCEKLDYEEEALKTYKVVLFLNPYDSDVAERVSILEDTEAMKAKYEIIRKDSPRAKERIIKGEEEDWVAIDLSINDSEPEIKAEDLSEEDQFDNWAMSKDNLTDEVEKKEKKEIQENVEDIDAEIAQGIFSQEEEPFVTHTLVDIYIAQKHFPKAKVLLEKILESNPSDEKSRKKLNDILSGLGDQPESYYKRLEKKYLDFLSKIQARAEIYTRA